MRVRALKALAVVVSMALAGVAVACAQWGAAPEVADGGVGGQAVEEAREQEPVDATVPDEAATPDSQPAAEPAAPEPAAAEPAAAEPTQADNDAPALVDELGAPNAETPRFSASKSGFMPRVVPQQQTPQQAPRQNARK